MNPTCVGEYNYQIDSKNRIRLPNKLKGEARELYFTKGTNHCIFVFFEDGYKHILDTLNEQIKMGDPEGSKAMRMFLKSCAILEGDSQGRMILPNHLKEYARIQKDIVICGAGSHVEIWAKEVYDVFYENEDEDFDVMFGKLGI
ncbi:MAG: hypothetical protein J1G07_02220 [Clostridiales bacterium]|nr:hypothetical protein [Clostridiales bacterium]